MTTAIDSGSRPRRVAVGRWLVRGVAAVVALAGVAKVADTASAGTATLHYDPTLLVGIGALELAIAGGAAWWPGRRLPTLALVAFLLAVTGCLLTVPPGELETIGCQCFGTRFRFQDIRSHLRFNGVLIVLASVGAWFSAFQPTPDANYGTRMRCSAPD